MDTADETGRPPSSRCFLGGMRLGRDIGRELGEGGSIAFVLSTSVRPPITGLAISNGLRPGLAMVAKNLADELGPRGIRVNGLLPGRVETERVRYSTSRPAMPPRPRSEPRSRSRCGRYGQPEEFGRAAAFLLSPAASFVTGAMLPVDGGHAAGPVTSSRACSESCAARPTRGSRIRRSPAARRTTTAGRRRSAARCRGPGARPHQRLRPERASRARRRRSRGRAGRRCVAGSPGSRCRAPSCR